MKKIITTSEYSEIINSPGKHVIKVSANWCNPCKVLASNINDLPDNLKDVFVEIDADDAEEDLIELLNVRNIPTLIFYNNRVEYKRVNGVKTVEELINLLNDTQSS